MTRLPVPRFALLLISCTALACGDATDASMRPAIQRLDSAGVELTRNLDPDRALDWTIRPAWQVGGQDEGPQAFFRVTAEAVAADGSGRLYVLDQGAHEISVFSHRGAHLRNFGGRGGGPGELRFPFALAVRSDGRAAVVDFGKGALVSFEADGTAASERRLDPPYLVEPSYVGSTLVSLLRPPGSGGDSIRSAIVAVTDTGYAVLAEQTRPVPEPVDLGCARVRGLEPVFQEELRLAPAGSRVVIARGAGYRLELRDVRGRLHEIVTRSVDPPAASPALAATELGRDSLRFPGAGDSECIVPVDEVVAARGYAERVPVVRDVVGAPDGGWWVERGVGPSNRRFDVFSAEGVYLGTLPAGTPKPVAFPAPTLYVGLERDVVGRVVLTAYRIERG